MRNNLLTYKGSQVFSLTRATGACWSGAIRNQTWTERLSDHKINVTLFNMLPRSVCATYIYNSHPDRALPGIFLFFTPTQTDIICIPFFSIVSVLLFELFPAGKKTVFHTIFVLNMDISQLLNELRHIHKKMRYYNVNTFFSCHSCTIFYACLKIFINFTIFAKCVSHFSSRVIHYYSSKLIFNLVWNLKNQSLKFPWNKFTKNQPQKTLFLHPFFNQSQSCRWYSCSIYIIIPISISPLKSDFILS